MRPDLRILVSGRENNPSSSLDLSRFVSASPHSALSTFRCTRAELWWQRASTPGAYHPKGALGAQGAIRNRKRGW